MIILVTDRHFGPPRKISPEHLSSIESGRRNPSWSVAQRLERFFSIPASELLAESNEEVPGKVIGDD